MEPSWHRPSLKNLAVLAVTISGTVAFKQWPQLMQGHAALGSSSFHRFFDAPQADSIRQCSRYYTNRSHFVGEGYRQAGWTQARWKEFGIPQTYINSHEVVLDYPEGSELTLLDLGAKSGVVLHEATLIEDLAATPGEGQLPFLPSFLAGTPAGNVTTQYVYANFGLQSDYDDLTRASISVEGKIVIAKTVFGSSLLERFNLSTSRVTQLRTAYQMKAAGLILYTDPQLDGNITEANGYRPFPHGPARPPSMIERGSAWAGGQSVPALPISYADAIPILRALNGHGPLADSFVLNLYTNPRPVKRSTHNTIGMIPGRDFRNEVVILGGHRDSWGPGAGDAVSGICALSEVARILGAALRRGWTPRRTIVLASFEGEELGGLGARAWLRENISSLNSSLIAYLNVVVAGAGSKFHAQGSPLLQNALQLATRGVPPPANNVDYWDGKISTGSGGDANTFQSQCFATLDFGFTPKSGDPVFPYHSLFDSEDWMNAFGDPDREYHKVITSLWLSLATLLADSLVLPILAADYAALMKNMVEGIRSQVQSPSALNLKALQTVIGKFQQACVAHDAYSHSLVLHSSQKLEQNSILNQIKDVNRKYITLERFFADPDKAQEDHDRHLILPGGSYYVKRPAFPKLNELIAEGNWSYAEVFMDKIVSQINKATEFLLPTPTD